MAAEEQQESVREAPKNSEPPENEKDDAAIVEEAVHQILKPLEKRPLERRYLDSQKLYFTIV